ncbi:MAG TPA: hypothetical protein VIP80_15580 [Gemmatimonadales bacterium]|jgi:hypothetical protein
MSRIRSLFVLVLLGGCGSSTTGPGGNGIGTFSAVIDGVAWTSDALTLQVATSQSVPGYQLISGTKVSGQNYVNIMLTLGYIGGTGTYPLGVNQGTNAGGSGAVTSQTGGVLGLWNTGFSGAAGTVTITSLTSTRMAGTFQFTAPPQLGSTATGNRVVTNGVFDVPLGTGFVVAPANNRGSKISATIGGAAWNGATVVGLGTGGAFSLGGTSSSYNLSFTTQTVVSAGNTYPFGSGFSVTASNGSTSWGALGSTGTVTITSLANGRAVGTFAGTLVGNAGAPGPLVFTNGSFDVRIDSP